ncbi:MAG: transporter [Bdellovibrionales bacterium]
MKHFTLLAGAAVLAVGFSSSLYAQDAGHALCAIDQSHCGHGAKTPPPISIMGGHTHGPGSVMFSYRYARMDMGGNRDGTRSLSPEEIATTIPNRFAGTPGQPATLRVVPTDMHMNMHMFGAMYGVNDWLTVMAMGAWMDKDMRAVTFAGGAGTTVLGTNTMRTQGWGDVRLNAMFEAYHQGAHSIVVEPGLSVPTGSIKEEATMLMPNGARMRRRASYGMQMGSGTYDFMPRVTYSGFAGDWSWGAQYTGEIRLEDENSQGYALGDKHRADIWGGYKITPDVSGSLRLGGMTQGKIDGIDTNISGAMQGADPDNYGGMVIEGGLALNYKAQNGVLAGHRFGVEVTAPLYQNLNGPQLERDYTAMIGWTKAF